MGLKIRNGSGWGLAALCVAVAMGSFACRGTQPDGVGTSGGHTPTPAVHFNPDSAYASVARQVAFGPRTPGSAAHDRCADYLYAVLAGYADTVMRQPFSAERWDGKAMAGVNIIAAFAPENPRRVLLAAHWDSRPYADQEADAALHHTPIDGANDGASGVGVLLEVARILAAHAPAVGVDIVLFDLEDAGRPDFVPYTPGDENTWCKGSQHWAEQPHIPGYTAAYGILLDMVGSRQPVFAQEATSLYYAADILDKVWTVAAEAGYGSVFVPNRTGGIIDDHLFVNRLAKIPMIDIIHKDFGTPTGFFPQWHTLQDNMAQIDPNTLGLVGKTVLETLYRE